MLTAASRMTSKKRGQARCRSTDASVNKCGLFLQWHVTRPRERNEAVTPATTWMNLEHITLGERSQLVQKGHVLCDPICLPCAEAANPQRQKRLAVARGCGEAGWGMTAYYYRTWGWAGIDGMFWN